MSSTLRTDHVTVADGSFDLHVWVPPSGHGPGIVLFQEIFGVGPYIRAVGARLADLGYVVAAPDVFWRLERNWASDHTPEGLTSSIGLVGRFDFPAGIADCVAAVARTAELPEVRGGLGLMGFCLGGLLTYHVAAGTCGTPLAPKAAVSYYGSNIASSLELAAKITCPIMFHFGGNDPYIPNEQVDAITAAFAGRPGASVQVESAAGHAFDNHEAAMFYNTDAAKRAWAKTTAFLGAELPTA